MEQILNIEQIVVPNLGLDLVEATRTLRDRLLNETVDRINPVWYASLTAEQQQQLQQYRQDLLDVTKQSGFPAEVQWPAKPSWL